MNIGSNYKSVLQKYIVSFKNPIIKKKVFYWWVWLDLTTESAVTITGKLQTFENKVNTPKKKEELNSRALMIERITYKMNIKCVYPQSD